MTILEALDRARSAMGQGCIYGLGRGGFDPGAPFPFGSDRKCDCSGFVAWCMGVSRKTDDPWYRNQNGGWIETTAIVRDCRTPFGLFDPVLWVAAAPGMLVVYPDTVVDGRRRQGHVGIVSAVGSDGPIRVIHCSTGNYRRAKDAIQETGVELWASRADTVVARCALLESATAA